ncbi:RIP metalloprotease RseP [Desulfovibrio oxyclinae]|jgi:regulator of sigma E protease|uniref:RIP metalloprotease RseP n=1 Tax=Desulfovibrio oxyclinae TaxID=63560 RepID=UPI00035DDC26|nr:RIP metalloprotease RseP [Desulfovibrio oxyclinae]
MATSFIAVIVILGGLIFFHELGHFLTARLFGMGVKTFSLGFGPKLFGFRKGLTEYKLSALPLGGYVQLAGESEEEEDEEEFPEETLFGERPAWQRILVVGAGPFFNFVLAFLIFWALLLAKGEPAMAPVIGQVMDDTPAKVAGLEAGDRVLSINGNEIRTWDELPGHIRETGVKPVTLTVEREGEQLQFTMTPKVRTIKTMFGEEVSVPLVGVAAAGEQMYLPVEGTGAIQAAEITWDQMNLVVTSFVKLVERILPAETIGGPIFLVQAVHEGTKAGLEYLLYLTAFISINLGIINLLPIPVLDGGHIVYFILEIIKGKPVDERWRAAATRVGLLLLLTLMAFAIFNDIRRLLS